MADGPNRQGIPKREPRLDETSLQYPFVTQKGPADSSPARLRTKNMKRVHRMGLRIWICASTRDGRESRMVRNARA